MCQRLGGDGGKLWDLQIFVEFWRQSQRFNGKLAAIIQRRKGRGFIGGCPPHL